ncbi:MAG: hypothetical protein N2C12_01220 [Planctomycetales bacterium]
MDADAFAWITLRSVYAWMYLYPALGLIRNWSVTVSTTGLLFKTGTVFFAFGSMVVMIVGSLMILFGLYGQFAAVALFGFNLGGAVIHYRLGAMAKATQLSESASNQDQATVAELANLGQVGHVTSAEKNFVLAAVALFFALVGTGKMSLISAAGIFG